SGLIVQTSAYGAVTYLYAVAYGVGKAANDRMALDMAHELRPYNVASISLWPGLVLTERRAAREASVPETARLDPSKGESPEFTGRMIVALASDPNIMDRSGGANITAEIAHEYGVTDITGEYPPSHRHRFGGPPPR